MQTFCRLDVHPPVSQWVTLARLFTPNLLCTGKRRGKLSWQVHCYHWSTSDHLYSVESPVSCNGGAKSFHSSHRIETFPWWGWLPFSAFVTCCQKKQANSQHRAILNMDVTSDSFSHSHHLNAGTQATTLVMKACQVIFCIPHVIFSEHSPMCFNLPQDDRDPNL